MILLIISHLAKFATSFGVSKFGYITARVLSFLLFGNYLSGMGIFLTRKEGFTFSYEYLDSFYDSVTKQDSKNCSFVFQS